jgi:SnoaL-like domain
MTTQLPPTAGAYVQSINNHDAAAFMALFTDAAVVDDVGREFRGPTAIKDWSDREIFDADVTVEVLEVRNQDGGTVVRTKVDGNFDRTGLPDPVIIDHHITDEGGKIVGLTCRLARNQRS